MRTWKIVLVLAIAAGTAFGQIGHHNLVASYPLRTNALDETGKNGPITLNNAPFSGGGVYSNGIYIYNWVPDFCLIETPQLNGLDFGLFAISVEFKVSEKPPFLYWPVFVGGKYSRWIGYNLSTDGTVALLYNNDKIVSSKLKYSLNVWHTATIIYNKSTQSCLFFLDFRPAGSARFALAELGDKTISNTNFSNAQVFKGWMRDLKVYSAPNLARLLVLLMERAGPHRGCDNMSRESGLVAPSLSASPNPFNPTTIISYELPDAAEVTLKVYDMVGREVTTLVNERMEAGVHDVKFDGASLASGAYLYRLQAADFVLTKRLMLVK
jgi:hypothetical protein